MFPAGFFVAVEIFDDVVKHAKGAMARWKGAMGKPVPHIEWIRGNGLNINPNKGEAIIGFDRIYIGASVDKEDLPKLANLLRPGGILVGPGMLRFDMAPAISARF
jgi:protein-L-isoaspartate O-methyltransferase